MDPVSSFNNICTPKTEDFSAELRQMIHDKNILTVRTRHKLLSDLDDMSSKAKEEKRESIRCRALEEIFTSEVTYLQQLDKVIKYFMTPMKSLNFLPHNEYNTIFGNIETIYNVNGELLVELKNDLEKAPFAFLKLAPFFKLYSFYAYDYKKAITILQKLENNNPEFKEFLRTQESCDEVQMKLPALLITPIQRIPRYRLLLKQVLDHSLPHHKNYHKLQEALKEVESTAEHINSLVEEHENIERMLELQRSLQNNYPCIIKPGRRLIKEGTLMKMSRKKHRGYSRYFVLMSDIIMYCKIINNNPKVLQCCCILPLNKCKIERMLKSRSFKLSCQNELFVLYSDSVMSTESWINTLKDSIIEYIDCRKTLRKDSSRRQPIRKKCDLELDYLGLSPSVLKHKRKFQKLENNNPEFKEFLRTQESCDEVQMKLPALLITPIQRIPRYRLLLKQVLDHSLPHHKNYHKLQEALKEVESTAEHINSLVEEHENIERMLELQRSLQNNYPCIIKPGRRLIKEGTLMKMSRKKHRGYSRYFVLMSDIIMYCKIINNNPKVLQCCCILPLNKCKIERMLKSRSFKLSCQNELFVLYSDSVMSTESWINTLKDSIIEYIDCRKTLRKDSSRRQPIRKKCDLELDYLGLSPSVLKHKRKFQEYEDIFYVQSDKKKENEKTNWFSFNFRRKRSLSPENNSLTETPLKRVKLSDNILIDSTNTQSTPRTSKVLNHETQNEPSSSSSKFYSMFSRIKNSLTNLFNLK